MEEKKTSIGCFARSEPLPPPLLPASYASSPRHSIGQGLPPGRHGAIGHISFKASLLSRCLSVESQEEDWELLLELYGEAIRKIAGSALRAMGFEANLDRVEELCQEVFLRWSRATASFDGRTDAAFWNFIQSSVRHALRDDRRRLSALKRRPRGRRSWMCRRIGSPYEVLLRKERCRVVIRHCLEAGTDEGHVDDARTRRQALALGWVVFAGCTSREASHRTGIRLNRVDHLVRRLRLNMSRDGISLPRRCKG